MLKKNVIIGLLLITISGLGLYFNKEKISLFLHEKNTPKLPESVTIEKIKQDEKDVKTDVDLVDTKETPLKNKESIPTEYNLAVPFAPQAPFANWDLPYQEACEEASLIMAGYFFADKNLDNIKMDAEILKLVEWEKNKFGYYQDTNAKEVAQIAKEYFGLKAELDYDTTVSNIKNHLAKNKLVIIPAAGRLLPNPYFSGEGPLYHMLVIRGYTKNHFITNDPGTRRGEGFLYKYDDLINAIHNWPFVGKGDSVGVSENDILQGEKVMIVVDSI